MLDKQQGRHKIQKNAAVCQVAVTITVTTDEVTLTVTLREEYTHSLHSWDADQTLKR